MKLFILSKITFLLLLYNILLEMYLAILLFISTSRKSFSSYHLNQHPLKPLDAIVNYQNLVQYIKRLQNIITLIDQSQSSQILVTKKKGKSKNIPSEKFNHHN